MLGGWGEGDIWFIWKGPHVNRSRRDSQISSCTIKRRAIRDTLTLVTGEEGTDRSVHAIRQGRGSCTADKPRRRRSVNIWTLSIY